KAGESLEYKEYLAGCGSDNDLHYDVKIKAAEMLMANKENTFVTPVFNGSASLRDAAGQMIENTAKAVRRKQTADDKFFDTMFDDMVSLYHLDQISTGNVSTDLGPLPGPAVALIAVLIAAWVVIIGVNLKDIIKKRKAGHNA
ncbi:MAG: ABC transporter substrate-binding protein, partial [Lachnospiraceae bacterium]|nr:ABC transporter substrate-binding protein [Lachnospiraceae bacterium]